MMNEKLKNMYTLIREKKDEWKHLSCNPTKKINWTLMDIASLKEICLDIETKNEMEVILKEWMCDTLENFYVKLHRVYVKLESTDELCACCKKTLFIENYVKDLIINCEDCAALTYLLKKKGVSDLEIYEATK